VVYGNTALTTHYGVQNDVLKGCEGYHAGLFTRHEWEQIRICPEIGCKISRQNQDTPLKTTKGEVFSVRPFKHQNQSYYWVRIENM